MKPVCDYDCFHCPYEECINDEMRLEDYQEGKKLELISGAKEYKTSESHRAAQKKYYEKNKERLAAYQKKYLPPKRSTTRKTKKNGRSITKNLDRKNPPLRWRAVWEEKKNKNHYYRIRKQEELQ